MGAQEVLDYVTVSRLALLVNRGEYIHQNLWICHHPFWSTK